MTTIEQLKSQLKICQDLGLTIDIEKLQQQLAEKTSYSPSHSVVKNIDELTEFERAEFDKMNIAPADVDEILATPYGLVVSTGRKRWMEVRLGKKRVTDVEMRQLKADFNTVLARVRTLEKGMTSADLPAHRVLMDKLSGIYETIITGGYEITVQETRHGFNINTEATS